ncbi:hypothetical protein BDQ12DRAFT_674475 [Crucibulum laeve]|uniref:Uncharacterized protein n=1 Tax=Crucibulum laeve TaxID=68775 RepID=A0A5C3MCK7_9AGAR|nr:hypothetical protein BDQ12DRAFT_674475 [Crucibulum laeve]
MAAPPSSQGISSGASPGPTVSRWGRNGEPGSAFSGLSRGGRGRGAPRGRGGRGSATAREPKAGGDARSDKADPPREKPSSASTAKPSVLSATTSTTEKNSSNSSNPSRPKPPSRRASRVIPVIAPPANSSSETHSPTTPRPQNRRRRSQAGKAALPQIKPPAPDDNLLRPNRPRLGPVPHSAPVKDTPPHLANPPFDIRNNIDALVERVRAVAMDHRPSTPGSHIDWAGDDDDSLPDLDDWGVTTATHTTETSADDMISPIIVDGLKPLPELNIKPAASSQGMDELLPIPSTMVRDQSVSPTPNSNVTPTLVPPIVKEKEVISSYAIPGSEASPEVVDGLTSVRDKPIMESKSNPQAASFTQKSLHPSLPMKPVTAASAHHKPRPGATAMRSPATPKTTLPKEKQVDLTQTNPENIKAVQNGPASEEEPANDHPANGAESEEGIAKSIHAPAKVGKDELLKDEHARVGLSASIHAPAPISDSLSVPNQLPSYSSAPTGPRNSAFTHSRAHTVGRPPSFPRVSPVEHGSRFSRSGHSTPRGGFNGGVHARTHSTPPTGTALSNHRIHTSRPVITGDAISRLARTIGNTSTSPPKPTAITTSND